MMRVHKKRDGWLLLADDGTVLRFMTRLEYIAYRVLCGVLVWHRAPDLSRFDGLSFGGNCSRCGVPVLCDSNGDWFETHHPTAPTRGASE